jgi:hypothetical protein
MEGKELPGVKALESPPKSGNFYRISDCGFRIDYGPT